MHCLTMAKWLNLVKYSKNLKYHYFSSKWHAEITVCMVLYCNGSEIKCGFNGSQWGIFAHKGG